VELCAQPLRDALGSLVDKDAHVGSLRRAQLLNGLARLVQGSAQDVYLFLQDGIACRVG